MSVCVQGRAPVEENILQQERVRPGLNDGHIILNKMSDWCLGVGNHTHVLELGLELEWALFDLDDGHGIINKM